MPFKPGETPEGAVPFKPGESGNPKGRPPRLLRHVLEEWKAKGYEPVSKAQIREAYEMLINLNEDELKEAAINKKSPMIVRIVAKGMLAGKGFEVAERMIDRAHGKAVSQNDVNLKGDLNINTGADLSKLTTDELKRIAGAIQPADPSGPAETDKAGGGAA